MTIKELLEKITPGPWRFEASSGGRWYVYPTGQIQPLCPNIYVPKSKLNNTRLMANAELIARAPALARSHERLKEATAPFREYIEKARSTWSRWGMDEGSKLGIYMSRPKIEALLAALAEAEKVSR